MQNKYFDDYATSGPFNSADPVHIDLILKALDGDIKALYDAFIWGLEKSHWDDTPQDSYRAGNLAAWRFWARECRKDKLSAEAIDTLKGIVEEAIDIGFYCPASHEYFDDYDTAGPYNNSDPIHVSALMAALKHNNVVPLLEAFAWSREKTHADGTEKHYDGGNKAAWLWWHERYREGYMTAEMRETLLGILVEAALNGYKAD